jgi:hypothetical protein
MDFPQSIPVVARNACNSINAEITSDIDQNIQFPVRIDSLINQRLCVIPAGYIATLSAGSLLDPLPST